MGGKQRSGPRHQYRRRQRLKQENLSYSFSKQMIDVLTQNNSILPRKLIGQVARAENAEPSTQF